jgi:hypothetical protein
MRDSRAAVEAAEEYADGLISRQELNSRATGDAGWVATMVDMHPKYVARMPERHLAGWEASLQPLAAQGTARAMAIAQQAELFREILGSPFRSLAIQTHWMTPGVIGLAQNIYSERAFRRIPELANALEEASCTESDVLTHCRRPAEHVRGCHILDSILGRK